MNMFAKRIKLLAAFLSFGLLINLSALAQSSLTNGLVAYYPFNGNANDASGFGNNGTVNGATLGSDRNGNPNSAYYFSGSQNITFTSPVLTATDNWSVVAWLNLSTLSQSSSAVTVGYDNGSTGNGYQLGIASSNGGNGHDVYATFGGYTAFDSGYSFPATNEWHHVALVRKSGVTQFYVDGFRTPNTSTRTPITPTALIIGSVVGSRYFQGAIDEVRIYNRALTTDEVTLLADGFPMISRQPVGAIGSTGGVQLFSVAALPASVKYQWQKNGINLSEGGHVIGVNGAALTLSSLSLSDAGSYATVLSNPYGTITSSNAVLVVTPYSAANGLVAYYPFSGNVNDNSGNSNNGTNHGAVLMPDRLSNPNSAYFFAGTQNITFANPPLTNLDNWTITAWLSPSTLSQVGEAVGLGYDDGSSGNGYEFGVNNGNIWCLLSGVDWIDSGYTFLKTNEWHHVAMFRTNGIIQFYVDNVLQPNSSTETPKAPTAFSIGSVANQHYFQGGIDEVRIYNRVLTVSEMSILSDGPPKITQQPTNIASVQHSNCTFIAAAGPQSATYQWQKNGVNLVNGGQISGVASTAITIANLSLADAGSYTVVASNSYGSVTSSPAILVVNTSPADMGLVAYYPFNGNVNDASGFANNGINNGATLIADRAGNSNSAYFFDGSHNITFGTVPLTNTDNWTIAAWLSPATLSQAGEAVAVGYDNVSSGNGYSLGITSSTGPAGRNVTCLLWGVAWVDSGFSFPTTNEWHHVAVVRANGFIMFYIDGTLTGNSNGSVPAIPTGFSIGSMTGQRFFRGAIDDVRIYNRALSASDISIISDGPPYFLQNPTNIMICPEASCIFTASAAPVSVTNYQWQKNGINLSNGAQISGANTTALTLSSVSSTDAGSYSVLVNNSYGARISPSGTLVVSSRPALVSLSIVNGFVVGASVLDGGCGYAAVPAFTFVGTNQAPPKGYIQITNGSVASVVITNPGFACASNMQMLIQPPIYSTMTYLHIQTNAPGAAATPQVTNGFIVGATVTGSSSGYPTPPAVNFIDASGVGASAIAQINSAGSVTNIYITNPGFGYTTNTVISITANLPSDAIIPGATDLMVGHSYQLQTALKVANWSTSGTAFTATNTVWFATNFWPLSAATNVFFRLRQ